MKSLVLILAALLLVSVVALGYVAINPAVEVQSVAVPAIQTVEYNDSAIRAEIAALSLDVNKDANWEAAAIVLAEADWNNNKDIYNALVDLNVTDIDNKGDIDKVVIRESDVSSDADECSATVVQEVRVYYENSDGDDKRVTLIITTEIKDNDVDDVEFKLD